MLRTAKSLPARTYSVADLLKNDERAVNCYNKSAFRYKLLVGSLLE